MQPVRAMDPPPDSHRGARGGVGARQTRYTRMIAPDADGDFRVGVASQLRQQPLTRALQRREVCPRRPATLWLLFLGVRPGRKVLRACGLEDGDLAGAQVGADG